MTQRFVSALVVLATTTTLAAAEPGDAPASSPWLDRWHVGVETSPVLFGLGGYLAEVAVRAPAAPHWRFVGAAFGVQLPSVAISSANQGWSVHDNGFSIGAERELFADRGGLFVAAMAVAQQRRTSRSDGTGTLLEYDVMPQVGYRWFPSRSLGLTITPSLGVPISLHRTAGPMIDGTSFDFPAVGIVPGIDLGWEL